MAKQNSKQTGVNDNRFSEQEQNIVTLKKMLSSLGFKGDLNTKNPEKAKEQLFAFLLAENCSKTQVVQLFRLFSKESNLGIRALNADFKDAKEEFLKKQREAKREEQTGEVARCLEMCENTIVLNLEQLREAKKEIWELIFFADPAFSDSEMQIVFETLAECTKASERSLSIEWKNARASFLAEESVGLRKLHIAELGIDIYPYVIQDGAFHRIRNTADGGVDFLPLCNFTSWKSQEIEYDDGAESKALYRIEGKLDTGRELPTIEVAREKYVFMNWVHQWQHGPILEAGQGIADHVRAATLKYSRDVKSYTVYTHTGWREIAGDWYYLHEGGAIGASEPSTAIETDIGGGKTGSKQDSKLKDYNLAVDGCGNELKTHNALESLRLAFKLLELGPKEVMVTLISGVFRAPLGESLPIDFSIFIAGLTGSFKTQLTAIIQSFFGAKWTGSNLPSNYEGTANSMEKEAFIIKDGIITFDDYNPTGSPNQTASYAAKSERIFRGQGNRSGRGRMNMDGSLRPTYFPRGLILSSGEDLPKGQSLLARILFLELKKGDIDKGRLTKVQNQAYEGVFVFVMTIYLKWLAPQIDKLRKELLELKIELRNKAAEELGDDVHSRLPDQIASLFIGWKMFLLFLLEQGAITKTEHDKSLEGGWRVLLEVARKQGDYQKEQDPVNRFTELLVAALSSGEAHMASAKDGKEPINPQEYGWREVAGNWQPQGECVGWVGEEGEIYLQGDNAYKVIQTISRAQGDNISMTKNTLYKRMRERGMLVKNDKGRNTAEIKVKGVRKKVIFLDSSFL